MAFRWSVTATEHKDILFLQFYGTFGKFYRFPWSVRVSHDTLINIRISKKYIGYTGNTLIYFNGFYFVLIIEQSKLILAV